MSTDPANREMSGPARALLAIGLVGWVAFGWLATHRSVSPEYFGRYSPEYTLFLSTILAVTVAVSGLAVAAVRRPQILRVPPLGGAVALLLGSIVVALLAGEVLVRSLDLLGVSFFEEVTRYVLDLEADPDLVYRHRAGFETTYGGVPFRTNEMGLRDRPLGDVPPDALRVVLLGDSVTLGWGVPIEDTFAARLAPALEARLGRPVRTVNAGVSGYNTEQELAFLERHQAALAPDLVVLTYVENDVEAQDRDIVDMRHRWENPPGASARLLKWSWLYRLFHFVLPDVVGSSAPPADRSGWDRSMRALVRLDATARAGGAELVTFLYRMTPDPVTDELRRDILELASDHGFAFFDTLPWFEDATIRDVINSFIDTHPNAAGHLIVAEGMARSLDEGGVLSRLGRGREPRPDPGAEPR